MWRLSKNQPIHSVPEKAAYRAINHFKHFVRRTKAARIVTLSRTLCETHFDLSP
jgi:hypothetical protein